MLEICVGSAVAFVPKNCVGLATETATSKPLRRLCRSSAVVGMSAPPFTRRLVHAIFLGYNSAALHLAVTSSAGT
jgi:hypothetical protein